MISRNPSTEAESATLQINPSRSNTLCAVCDVETGNYHHNYGAITCLSCRAFFRRAVQGKSSNNFKCKDGNCDVTLKECRCCKRCRFAKCLRVGMDPKCVMDASAVKSRFSKYIARSKDRDQKASTMAQVSTVKRINIGGNSKRKRQKSAEAESKILDDDLLHQTEELPDLLKQPLDDAEDISIQLPSLCALLQEPQSNRPQLTLSNLYELHTEDTEESGSVSFPFYDEVDEECDEEWSDFDLNLLLSQGELESPHIEELVDIPQDSVVPIQAPGDDIDDTLETVDDMKMLAKAKSMRKDWLDACHLERCHETLVECLINSLSQNQRLSVMLIDGMITKYKNVFMAFANVQGEFLTLSKDDRLMLINRNAALFVQYIFARVISSKTIGQQLQWLLLLDNPLVIENESNMCRITVHDLLTHADLQSMQEYILNSDIVGKHMQFTDTGKVAFCCLFQTSSVTANLEGKEKVMQYQKLIYKYVHWSHDIFNTVGVSELKACMDALANMVNINYKNNLALKSHLLLSRSKSVNMFKQEEDTWVEYHIHSFDLIFDQVSFGPDFVKECIMHSMGVPLSKHFLLQGASVWGSRFQQILMQHREFAMMSEENRSRLLSLGPPAAFAIIKAKLENCKTGSEQFHIKFGHEDEVTLNEVFNVEGQMPQLKPVLLMDWSKTFHKFDVLTLERFHRIAVKLAPLLKTTDTLKLMMLLAMFGSLGSEFQPQFEGVMQMYMGALKHCIKGITESTIEEAMCDTRELTAILQDLSLAATTEINEQNVL